MRSTSIAKTRAELSVLVNQVAHAKERIVITSRGRPKAALVSLEDLGALEELPLPTVPEDSVIREADLLVERIRRRGGAFVSDNR